MRTLLSQFCEEFDQIVRPLLTPLSESAQQLNSLSGEISCSEIQAKLRELRHQMESLANKVAEQQAYVLIFGPLKSGKSTLMNALSASYVSEVSSLPAYPCMVFVSHSPTREYLVTYYNGETEVFTDSAALHIHINRAHGELADRIRATEETSGQFDPEIHYPRAIRRVDVKLPAGDLESSGAVLVDTPGLYSRMRFGYDRMTREFRNAAACAIFVVRSDNLFLEQVFEEFGKLLELFSRIFLVVNLDTTKRDLSPDGQLVPSLEQADPQRIIEAFENLAMSAPLKKAASEGRLRIYPVGLLHAASSRLRAAQDNAELDEEESIFNGQANFNEFQKDFTDYLNSTDYLVAFLGDSLRRASNLLGESDALTDHPTVFAVGRKVKELESDKTSNDARIKAVERLVRFEWSGAFGELQEALSTTVHGREQEVGQRAARKIEAALVRWFETDSSLEHLVNDEWTPALMEYQEELSTHVSKALDEHVHNGHAGVRLPLRTAEDLGLAEVDLGAIGSCALTQIGEKTFLPRPEAPLHLEQVPIRKRIWDWLLFRSRSAVRRRLFGSSQHPSQKIPVEAKKARLGEAARGTMALELDSYLERFSAETINRMHGELLGDYARSTIEDLEKRLDSRRKELEAHAVELDQALARHRTVMRKVDELKRMTTAADSSIEGLSDKYGKTDPDMLIQPVGGDAKPLPTSPAGGLIGPATTPAEEAPSIEAKS